MSIHQWQEEFEFQSKEDTRVILDALSDLAEKQKLFEEVLAMQQQTSQGTNPMRDVMDLMQSKLSLMEVGDPRHNALQRNLHYFQEKSGDLLPEMELTRGEVQRMGKVRSS
jgi:hypothetical protein